MTVAINHWRLAVETYGTNFPHVALDCADISQCDPRRYPTTVMGIFSPECTNHTAAKGIPRAYQHTDLWGRQPDPGAERSRSTMWDVPRFAEVHRYQIMIVENVIEARQWVMWPAWLQAMDLLGYDHRCVYLNSMFAHPTPQSRDRMYVVFWRKGNPAPDLEIRPRAWCVRCARLVASVQSWKPGRTFGRYKRQYDYRCPACAQVVEPFYCAAANAIDWSLPTPRIGDRARPLRPKTLARIQAGLDRFAAGRYQPNPAALFDSNTPPWVRQALTTAAGGAGGAAQPPFTLSEGAWDTVYRAADEALPAQTSSRSNLLTIPFVTEVGHGGAEHAGRIKPGDAPLSVQHTLGGSALVTVPFLAQIAHAGENAGRFRRPDDVLPTQHTGNAMGVVNVPLAVPLTHEGVTSQPARSPARSVGLPLPTQTARAEIGVAAAPFIAVLRNHSTPHDLDEPLMTVEAGANHHVLVDPLPPMPFSVSYNGTDAGTHALNDALGAQPTHDRHAIVAPIVAPTTLPNLDDCGFRVLAPHEVQRAMAFADDYVVLGTNRDKVRMLGNAVTPPVMELLIERCLATLRG